MGLEINFEVGIPIIVSNISINAWGLRALCCWLQGGPIKLLAAGMREAEGGAACQKKKRKGKKHAPVLLVHSHHLCLPTWLYVR